MSDRWRDRWGMKHKSIMNHDATDENRTHEKKQE